jgi:hypothetical protein
VKLSSLLASLASAPAADAWRRLGAALGARGLPPLTVPEERLRLRGEGMDA